MPALDVVAALVLPDGRRWGEVADPVQWADARAVLDPASETPYHFLTRARGWSKTTDLAAFLIAIVLTQLKPNSRVYCLAADRDQGALLLNAIRGFVQRTTMLRGAFTIENFRVRAIATGTVVEVLAADAPGAYGLLPDFVVVDELAQWSSTPRAREL